MITEPSMKITDADELIGMPKSIPFSYLSETMAKMIHHQSLEELNRQGGMSSLAILKNLGVIKSVHAEILHTKVLYYVIRVMDEQAKKVGYNNELIKSRFLLEKAESLIHGLIQVLNGSYKLEDRYERALEIDEEIDKFLYPNGAQDLENPHTSPAKWNGVELRKDYDGLANQYTDSSRQHLKASDFLDFLLRKNA